MNKRILLAIITVPLLLAGCGKSIPANTVQQNSKSSSVVTAANSADSKSTVTTTSSDSKNENINSKLPAMNAYKEVLQKKQEYKAKLDKIKLGFKGFNSATATTNDMYQKACKEYKQWDAALNEIYGILQLPAAKD